MARSSFQPDGSPSSGRRLSGSSSAISPSSRDDADGGALLLLLLLPLLPLLPLMMMIKLTSAAGATANSPAEKQIKLLNCIIFTFVIISFLVQFIGRRGSDDDDDDEKLARF